MKFDKKVIERTHTISKRLKQKIDLKLLSFVRSFFTRFPFFLIRYCKLLLDDLILKALDIGRTNGLFPGKRTDVENFKEGDV